MNRAVVIGRSPQSNNKFINGITGCMHVFKRSQYMLRIIGAARMFIKEQLKVYTVDEAHRAGLNVMNKQLNWQVDQMKYDPCLFKITTDQGRNMLIVVHTDDVDGVCDDPRDAEIFHTGILGTKVQKNEGRC